MLFLKSKTFIILAAIPILYIIILRAIYSGTLINQYDYSTVVFDKNQELVQVTLTKDEKYRLPADLSQVSPKFLKSTLLYEDKYFYYHPGINPFSLLRATFYSVFKTANSGGASTITMQLVRLRHSLHTRTIFGKLKQIIYALWYECLYSKSEILSLYLSIAPYGGNVEGIEAASLIYYAKPSSALDYNESVRLAVLPQNPTKRWRENQKKDFDNAITKMIARVKHETHEAHLVPKPFLRLPNEVPHFAKHFVDRLKQVDNRVLFNSTLNLAMQKEVEKVVSNYMKIYKELNLTNASVLITEGKQMNVRAYLGSASYTDPNIEGFVNGLAAKRSPGSLLKPFIYALGIDQGLITNQTTLYDLPIRIASYHPENFERNYLGPLSATDALVKSRNIPALELFRKLKKDSFYSFLEGGEVRELKPPDYYGIGLVLGGIGTTAEEIAQLYGVLAHYGTFAQNRFFEEQKVESHLLLSPEASHIASEMLSHNPPALSKFRNASISWKTGTSYGSRDAWAVGYFDNYIIVVWLGNFNNKPNPNLIGRDIAGPILFSLADVLKTNFYVKSDNQSSNLNIKKVEVCALSGQLPNETCPHRKEALFIPGVSPIRQCQNHKRILIDTETGKRACDNCARCESKLFEVWDSVTYDLFSNAGMKRSAPPAFDDACTIKSSTHQAAIRIISPEPHLEYILEDHRPLELELLASVNSQSKTIHWFLNSEIIAQGPANQVMYWRAIPGKHTIRAVDNLGNSASVTIVVRLLK